jgi:hypothetical protein
MKLIRMKSNRGGLIVRLTILSLFLIGIGGTQAQQQYPMLDQLADKVIQKYQSTPCQELQAKSAAHVPPSPQEQRVIQLLKGDPQMRVHFINRIAAPIANKMFDCGLIP